MKVTLIVGTAKGAFIFRSDESRKSWKMDGPLFRGWGVTAVARDAGGTFLFATASDVYGVAMHKSDDLKEWRQVPEGPAYAEGGDRKLKQIWRIVADKSGYYAGVAEAGLFRSGDGEKWTPVRGLNEHRTSKSWMPGAGGLCAHTILIDPKNTQRIWIGISAVGVFRSDDGGETWQDKNQGVPVILEDKDHCEIGYCVHAMVPDPDNADIIYRQDHRGMFKTTDGGESYTRIETGLPSGFGFPLVIDRNTKALYAVPLESDEYRFAKDGCLCVYRSTDGGDSWSPLADGLPQGNAYVGVLRSAMAVDNLESGGVYFGTTSGDVYASSDGGDYWTALPCRLPRVQCVAAFIEAA